MQQSYTFASHTTCPDTSGSQRTGVITFIRGCNLFFSGTHDFQLQDVRLDSTIQKAQ
ncbi:MAG: hypothetical protein ACK44P_09325 [Bacteroidota bacterium]|jgi:hypothetical protein|nr:hypothetical protein [Sphingobacteriales bacterium]